MQGAKMKLKELLSKLAIRIKSIHIQVPPQVFAM